MSNKKLYILYFYILTWGVYHTINSISIFIISQLMATICLALRLLKFFVQPFRKFLSDETFYLSGRFKVVDHGDKLVRIVVTY